jgi:hypothetical protein
VAATGTGIGGGDNVRIATAGIAGRGEARVATTLTGLDGGKSTLQLR